MDAVTYMYHCPECGHIAALKKSPRASLDDTRLCWCDTCKKMQDFEPMGISEERFIKKQYYSERNTYDTAGI